MKSVKYEGFYPCMNNHSIDHVKSFMNSRRNIFWCALLNFGEDGRKGKKNRE
jgi:hypothetical protein